MITVAPGLRYLAARENRGSLVQMTSLFNSTGLIETVRLGAIGGSVSTTTGTIQLDGFDSWR